MRLVRVGAQGACVALLGLSALLFLYRPAYAGSDVVVINAPPPAEMPVATMDVDAAPDANWLAAADALVPPVTADVVAAGETAPVKRSVVALAAAPVAPDAAAEVGFLRKSAGGTEGLVTTRYGRKKRHAIDRAAEASVVRISAAAAAAKGFNLVECIAGCVGERNSVVYYAPRVYSLPVDIAAKEQPGMPAAVASAMPSEPAMITCLAGCYGTEKSYLALPVPPRQQHAGLAVSHITTAAIDKSVDRGARDTRGEAVRVRTRIAVKGRLSVRARLAARGIRRPTAWRTVTLRPWRSDVSATASN